MTRAEARTRGLGVLATLRRTRVTGGRRSPSTWTGTRRAEGNTDAVGQLGRRAPPADPTCSGGSVIRSSRKNDSRRGERVARPRMSSSKLALREQAREGQRRLLFIVPWAALGGADRFNLDLDRATVKRRMGDNRRHDAARRPSMDAGVQCTHARCVRVLALPEAFGLSAFPRLRHSLATARRHAHIQLVFAYKALAYLRRAAGDVPIVDFCHMEQEEWLNGGYPRLSVEGRELIDLHVTSSQHLKDWEVRRGVDPERVEVCYTNVQPRATRASASRRAPSCVAVGRSAFPETCR